MPFQQNCRLQFTKVKNRRCVLQSWRLVTLSLVTIVTLDKSRLQYGCLRERFMVYSSMASENVEKSGSPSCYTYNHQVLVLQRSTKIFNNKVDILLDKTLIMRSVIQLCNNFFLPKAANNITSVKCNDTHRKTGKDNVSLHFDEILSYLFSSLQNYKDESEAKEHQGSPENEGSNSGLVIFTWLTDENSGILLPYNRSVVSTIMRK